MSDAKQTMFWLDMKSGEHEGVLLSTFPLFLACLRDTVAPYKVTKVVEFFCELPAAGVGKIVKRELKAMMIKE